MQLNLNTDDMYLKATKKSYNIAIAAGISLAALGVAGVALAGISIPALLGALALGTTMKSLEPDIEQAGFGGFPYWGLDMYKSPKTTCPYDCQFTTEEMRRLQTFLMSSSGTGLQYINKYYCISCENGVAKFVSNTSGDIYVCKLKTTEQIAIGEVLYTIGRHCFLKAYLEDIDYDYSKFMSHKKYWQVATGNKVKFVNK